MKLIFNVLVLLIIANYSFSQADDKAFVWDDLHGIMLRDEIVNEQVAKSLGRIFVISDRTTRFEYGEKTGVGVEDATFNFSIAEYDKNIKSLSVKDRVDFLWVLMWRLDLSVSTVPQLEEIISRDCAKLFLAKLNRFIVVEDLRGSQSNKNKLRIAKIFKQDIVRLANVRQSKSK